MSDLYDTLLLMSLSIVTGYVGTHLTGSIICTARSFHYLCVLLRAKFTFDAVNSCCSFCPRLTYPVQFPLMPRVIISYRYQGGGKSGSVCFALRNFLRGRSRIKFAFNYAKRYIKFVIQWPSKLSLINVRIKLQLNLLRHRKLTWIRLNCINLFPNYFIRC